MRTVPRRRSWRCRHCGHAQHVRRRSDHHDGPDRRPALHTRTVANPQETRVGIAWRVAPSSLAKAAEGMPVRQPLNISTGNTHKSIRRSVSSVLSINSEWTASNVIVGLVPSTPCIQSSLEAPRVRPAGEPSPPGLWARRGALASRCRAAPRRACQDEPYALPTTRQSTTMTA